MPEVAKEVSFEDAIELSLTGDGGYTSGADAHYEQNLALDLAELFDFVTATQSEEWARLVQLHGGEDAAREKFADRVAKQIDQHGTIDVLRHGVTDHGVTIRLAYFKPAHGLTPDLVTNFEANRLTVTRQLRYSPAHENELDLCLLVNGLPVATAELKNPLTNQTVEHAKKQYREDRDPRDTLLGKRAVVHFAVDPDEVYMTTQLAGAKTQFLPFNRGSDGGPGNPPNPAGHRTAYLWEQVWARDPWLDILARFIHVERPPEGSSVAKKKASRVIFPRFHQWDAVLKLEADARAEGPGHRYLVEHSAGSGKSNTIAWLAHRLATLHDADDEKVFHKVIVITDRIVLDHQLQDTIYQFEHKHGMVEKIGGSGTKSEHLAHALESDQALIVVCTLQTFPFVQDLVGELGDRRYAVVVDEAHSSQTGEAAKDLKAVLGAGREDDELSEAEAAESGGVLPDAEDRLAAQIAARGHQPNLSFFAFTATPKAKTLELFGRKNADGKLEPFHLYSMRQAIEEGFILDVLKTYVTYDTYWRVEKAVTEDPEFDPAKAVAAVARYVSLHPYNLAQKAEIVVEHFRAHTAKKIGGRAKAMVVTASRLHAVRYKRALDAYIAEKGYTDVKTLVAFSGKVIDEGIDYTESWMNPFPDTQTRNEFDTDEYQVMVVAEKFQTGYDQPLLHTMFVDKKLEGVAAVQTLSRLNRIAPGKDDTFVLDFRNDAEEIQKAFTPFYETTITEPTDPNALWDARDRLWEYDVLREDEIEAFAQVFFSSDASSLDHGKLYAFLDPAVDRFKIVDEEAEREYRDILKRFVNLYSFLGQIVQVTDPSLEKTYVYTKALRSRLPRRGEGGLDLGSDVELTHLRTEKTFEGDISLGLGEGGELPPAVTGGGVGKQHEPESEHLSTIVDLLNERFGLNLGDADQLLFDQFREEWIANPDLHDQATANPIENFKFGFDKVFDATIIERMGANDEIFRQIMDNPDFAATIKGFYLKEVYDRLRGTQGK